MAQEAKKCFQSTASILSLFQPFSISVDDDDDDDCEDGGSGWVIWVD